MLPPRPENWSNPEKNCNSYQGLDDLPKGYYIKTKPLTGETTSPDPVTVPVLKNGDERAKAEREMHTCKALECRKRTEFSPLLQPSAKRD